MRTLPKSVIDRLKVQLEAETPSGAAVVPAEIPTAVHPDANLLVGFGEQTITDAERAKVIDHLTTCASCRAVAAFALPEQVPAEIPVRTLAGPGWSAIARWGTIATAAGVLTFILIAHLHLWNTPGLSHVAIPPRPAGGVIAGPQDAGASVPSVQAVAPSATANAQLPANGLAAGLAKVPEAPEANLGLVAAPIHTPARTQVTVMASSQPPPTLRAHIVSAVAGRGAAEGNAAAAPMELAAPSASPVGAAQAIPEAVASSAQASRVEAAASRRSRSVVWRIAADGTAQRSLDGGKSFAPIAIAAGTRLQVIAAFGTSVWVGGADGILLQSADEGATWTQVSSNFSRDAITRIQLRDPQHLTIGTASGSRWASEDGGQHWQRQP